MSKFKIGDTVKRINCDNGSTGAMVGQQATVVSVDFGFVYVTYPGSMIENGSKYECWFIDNTELVARGDEARASKFPIGTTGLTRNKQYGYEVVAIDRGLLVVRLEDQRTGRVSYSSRYESGMSYSDMEDAFDLLPPAPKTKKVWVNIYPASKGKASNNAMMWDSEQTARTYASHDAIAVAVPVEVLDK